VRDGDWLVDAGLPFSKPDQAGGMLEYGQRIWSWIHLLEQWDYLLTAGQLGKEGV